MIQNFWDAAKPEDRGKIIPVNTYSKTEWGDLQDGGGVRCEITFLPTSTSKIHLHVEQLLQNTY